MPQENNIKSSIFLENSPNVLLSFGVPVPALNFAEEKHNIININ